MVTLTENQSKLLVRVKYGHRILTLVFSGWFTTFLGWVGGWVGEIEDRVHLSQADAEIGAELGNFDNIVTYFAPFFNRRWHKTQNKDNQVC